MITFAVERFSDAYYEALPLLYSHYEEISVHKKRGYELNAQIETYLARERDGTLFIVVGREAGQLVAYFAAFIAPALHYQDCLTCSPDIFYVAPDRRTGIAGIRMFRFVEKELKRRGVKRWAVGSKTAHDASGLFRFLGFEQVETTFEKWLDDCAIVGHTSDILLGD